MTISISHGLDEVMVEIFQTEDGVTKRVFIPLTFSKGQDCFDLEDTAKKVANAFDNDVSEVDVIVNSLKGALSELIRIKVSYDKALENMASLKGTESYQGIAFSFKEAYSNSERKVRSLCSDLKDSLIDFLCDYEPKNEEVMDPFESAVFKAATETALRLRLDRP